MRRLEILLVVADLVAFVVLVVPLRGRGRWLRYATLLPLLVTGVQLLVEGPRWQMVPAYALGVLFFLTWLVKITRPVGRPAGRRWVHRIAVGLGVGLGVLGLAVSAALPTVFPVFGFPRPSGPYQIGTVTYHWVDTGRHEIFSVDPNARRELMAQVWYPVKGSSSSARAPYMQDAHAFSSAVTRGLVAAGQVRLPEFFFDHFRYVTTHAIPSAPVATDNSRYPVLIFLSGIGGFRQSNTFQVEELVSHGYIVVGLDQPYAAATVVFPDGHRITGMTRDRLQPFIDQSTSPAEPAPTLNGGPLKQGIAPYLTQDVSFALDQLAALDAADPHRVLTGRLDLQRVGTFGISLGAIVAGEACHTEPRLKACLMMDAAMPADVVKAGLRQPSMWITRDAGTMRLEQRRGGGWPEAAIHEALTSMRAVYLKSPPGDGYYVQVPGMFHPNFTDAPYWSPLAYQMNLGGPIDRQLGFNIVNAYSVAFFDQELQGKPTALLGGPNQQYPEVLLETH
jgi:predicted dienelactone hydrolase